MATYAHNNTDDTDKPGASNSMAATYQATSAASSSGKFSKPQPSSRGNSRQSPGPFRYLLNALARKKPLDERTDTCLNRCLNLLDLTSLGVGSTLGLGLYVLAGQVASTKAGPAVIISFGLAALASAFSALCYAEFAGRVPLAGSAYVYSYITVGEFVAFIIGWNLILEYVIGASSVARGFSGYLRLVYEHATQAITSSASGLSQSGAMDSPTTITSPGDQSIGLPSGNMSQASRLSTLINSTGISVLNHGGHLLASTTGTSLLAQTAGGQEITTGGGSSGMEAIVEYVTRYFDWPSIAILFVITVFILVGVKESTNVTLLFTAVNLIVVVTVVCSSFSHLNLHNWQLTPDELPPGGSYGRGGFMPFGWSGVLAGSATCFFGFIGFDTIASSAEEAKNPKRNLPLSIILSLFISFIAYMLVAIVQTLLWPYYDQDKITILPYIFGKLNMPITYWIVLLGAAAGLASSQLGGMYPLPRILYSMAQDKLIYHQLAHVNKRLKLPVRATIIGSIFVALLACLLDIQDLADMVSIGTLAAYSLVSISVLLVRYETNKETVDDSSLLAGGAIGFTELLALEENFQRSKKGTDSETKNQLRGESEDPDVIIQKGTKSPNSWLAAKVGASGEENNEKYSKTSTKRRQRLLDLLITWNTADNADNNQPDDVTCFYSKILIALIVILSTLLDVIVLGLVSAGSKQSTSDQQHALVRMINGQQYVSPETVLVSSGCIVLVTMIAVVLMLSRLPTSKPTHPDMFLVPFVPIIPTLSIIVNTFLMLNLSYLTWIRFSVWMAVGFFIYFTYGIWNSEGYMLRVVSRNKK
jgi:amino acid transporter